ncbi:MAG: hypothetical protein KDB07_13050 [Planctomycetes bacterium]|nr:hypothetical protein [Planctomycetota bacterium]
MFPGSDCNTSPEHNRVVAPVKTEMCKRDRRDMFAAAALSGLLMRFPDAKDEVIADRAFSVAKIMMNKSMWVGYK